MALHHPLGKHATLDASDIPFHVLDDAALLQEALVSAATGAGATVLSEWRHEFSPNGVTVLVLLAESHASIHTYPEHGVLMADAFTCGDVDPGEIVRSLCAKLGIRKPRVRFVDRGFERAEV